MSENSILEELIYDSEKGALHYKGVRYLLIRPETLAAMQKAMEDVCGKESDEIIFQGGFEGGYLSAKRYKEIHGFCDEEILDFMIRMGSQIGWGVFHLALFDQVENRICIEVENSAFAEAYGKSSGGVCHLIRGVVSGLATAIFEKNITASETSCTAKGDKKCSFVVGDEPDMAKHVPLLKGKRILIVDDEPDILSTLKEILDGCDLSTAKDFEKAKKLLAEKSFDAAIFDIMGVNGYDLLKITVKNDIPTLMLTAHALSPADFVKSMQGGAQAYLPKDKIAEIETFLLDVMEAQEKKEKKSRTWFARLEPFFRERFGVDWKEKTEPEFWEKYYYL